MAFLNCFMLLRLSSASILHLLHSRQYKTTSARSQAPRPTQLEPALCARLEWLPGESRESKQAYRMTPAVHVVSHCSLMPGWWLASGDQRQLMGSGSALETCSWQCAIQMAAFTLLCTLYFTSDCIHYDFCIIFAVILLLWFCVFIR